MVAPAVVDVEVESSPDGRLLVRWVVAGAPTEVDVAVGPTPETVDHRHVERVPAEHTETVLDDPGPGRHYVSVSPSGGGSAVVAGERRVPFEAVTNFRDLGGYPVTSGGRTRWGRVFRADALHQLSTADLVAFERLGLRVVYDLRSESEATLHPDVVPSVHLPLLGRLPGHGDDPASRRANAVLVLSDDGVRWLRDLYLGMLEHAGPTFGRLLGSLVGAEGIPAVFHCRGGKDRTGMAAALLLLVLGVDDQRVLDDYELTSRFRTVEHQGDSLESLLAQGIGPEAAAGILSSPRPAMAEALAELDRRWGGAEAYLLGPAGLDRDTVVALQETLVTR